MLATGLIVLCIANLDSSNAHFSDLISQNEGEYDMVKNIVFAFSTGVNNLSTAASISPEKEVFRDQIIPEFKPVHPQTPYGPTQNSQRLQPLLQDNHKFREMESQIEKRYAEENNPPKGTETQNILHRLHPNMPFYTSQEYYPAEVPVTKNIVEHKPMLNEVVQQKQVWYDHSMMFPTKNKVPFTFNKFQTNSKTFLEPKLNKSSQSDYFFKFFVNYGAPEKVNMNGPVEQQNGLQFKENVDNENIRSSLALNAIQNTEVPKHHQGIMNSPFNKIFLNTPWYGFKTTPPSCVHCSHLNWLHHYYSRPQVWKNLNTQNGATKQEELVGHYRPNKYLYLDGSQMIHSDGMNFNEFFKQAEGNRDYSSIELTTLLPDASVTPEINVQESRVQQGKSRSPRLLPYPYLSPDQGPQRVTSKFGPEDARALINGYFSSGIEQTNIFFKTTSDPKEGNLEHTYQTTPDPKDGNEENSYRISTNHSTRTEDVPNNPPNFNFHQHRQPFLFNDNSGQWRPVLPKVTENQMITTPLFSLLNYEYDTTTPNYQSVKVSELPSGQNSSNMLINVELHPRLPFTASENILNTRDTKPYPESYNGDSLSKSFHNHSFEKRNDMEYEDETITEDQDETDSYEDEYSNKNADESYFLSTQETRNIPREDVRTVPSFQSIDHPAGFGKGQLPRLQRYFRIYPITGRYKEYFPPGFR